MPRNRDSVKARRICFEAHRYFDPLGRARLDCHFCGASIDPAIEKWRADHIRRHANGGEDTAENLWPIHLDCDVKHKAPDDNREIKKGTRVRDRHFGITRPRGFPRPKDAVYDWSRRRYVRAGKE